MRILQGYVSKSVMSFPFHQIYRLDDYNDDCSPSVFFGMYRYEDYQILISHPAHKIVFWTGQDALDFKKWGLDDDYKHVTAHPKVYELIKSKGVGCELVKPAAFLNEFYPQKLGPKIYAYCPTSAPDYHGKKVLDELKAAGYEIIIGDGATPQHLWKYTQDAFYGDIFIGLCLSEFAGGGTSIIEMGLRGIKVVTNVFDLPNCIPWTDARQIAGIIENEKQQIGNTNKALAQDVWDSLDHEFKWLEL
jgi:hypothetical protein